MMQAKKKTYKELLNIKLTTEAYVIKELTDQARCDLQYQEQLGLSDMTAILNFLRKKQADDRKPVLYLIDSLVKSDPAYRQLFREHIVGIFESTWKYGSQPIRKSITKILDVWHSRQIYDQGLIRELFEKLKSHPTKKALPQPPPPVPRPPSGFDGSASSFDASHFDFGSFDTPSQPRGNGYGNGMSSRGYYNGGANNRNGFDYGNSYNQQNHGGGGGWQGDQFKSYGYNQSQNFQRPQQDLSGGFDWNTALQELSNLAERVPRFSQKVKTLKQHYIMGNPNCDSELRNLFAQMKSANLESRVLNQLMNQARARSVVNAQQRSVDPNAPLCQFFNTPDGCRKGQRCPMRHISEEEEARRKVIMSRNKGWYAEEESVVYSPDGDVHFHTVFDERAIKKPHRRSHTLIYRDKGLSKCSMCGFRFPDGAVSVHMDWHFKVKNEILNSKGDHRTTPYYTEDDGWVKLNESKQTVATPFEETQPEIRVRHSVPASNVYTTCYICAEEMEKKFNPVKDEWDYNDAMYYDGTTEPVPDVEKFVVHQKCYESHQQRQVAEENSEAILKPETAPSVLEVLKEHFGSDDEDDDEDWHIKEDDEEDPKPEPPPVATPPKAEEEQPKTLAPLQKPQSRSVSQSPEKGQKRKLPSGTGGEPPAKKRRLDGQGMVPQSDEDEDDEDEDAQFFGMQSFVRTKIAVDEDDDEEDDDEEMPDAFGAGPPVQQIPQPAPRTQPPKPKSRSGSVPVTAPATEISPSEEVEEEAEYWSEHEEEYESRSEATSLEDFDDLDIFFTTVCERTIYYDIDNNPKKYGLV